MPFTDFSPGLGSHGDGLIGRPPLSREAVRSLVHGLCLPWDYQTLVWVGGVKVAMGRTSRGPGMPVRSGEERPGRRGTLGDGAGAFVSLSAIKGAGGAEKVRGRIIPLPAVKVLQPDRRFILPQPATFVHAASLQNAPGDVRRLRVIGTTKSQQQETHASRNNLSS